MHPSFSLCLLPYPTRVPLRWAQGPVYLLQCCLCTSLSCSHRAGAEVWKPQHSAFGVSGSGRNSTSCGASVSSSLTLANRMASPRLETHHSPRQHLAHRKPPQEGSSYTLPHLNNFPTPEALTPLPYFIHFALKLVPCFFSLLALTKESGSLLETSYTPSLFFHSSSSFLYIFQTSLLTAL